MKKTTPIKKISLLLAIYCISISIQANIGKNLVVEKNSGEKNTFLLSQTPVLTFDDRTLKITIDGESFYFQIDDVKQYYFEIISEPSKIITNNSCQNYTIHCLDDNTVLIVGIKSHDIIKLFSIDGKNYSNYVSIGNGEATVSFRSLPLGVYIVRINNQSLKVFSK